MTREEFENFLKTVTVDQFVTKVKLNGSSAIINGHTKPEGWPFAVVVAIGSPGNQMAVEMVRQLNEDLAAVCLGVRRDNVDDPPKVWP